jgi:hypothetical protein
MSAQPASVVVQPGTSARLQLSGTLRSGNTSLTWSSGGTPLGIWDLELETD